MSRRRSEQVAAEPPPEPAEMNAAVAIPDPIVETPLEKDGHEVDVPIPEPAGLSKAP